MFHEICLESEQNRLYNKEISIQLYQMSKLNITRYFSKFVKGGANINSM